MKFRVSALREEIKKDQKGEIYAYKTEDYGNDFLTPQAMRLKMARRKRLPNFFLKRKRQIDS